MSDTERLDKLLHKIAAEQNYRNYDLKVTPLFTDGANYASLLYLATISADKDLDLFIKVSAVSQEMREQISGHFFETEKVVYTELKEAYELIEKKYEVPEEHCLFIPKYYGADMTNLKETLVLENLATKGFKTHDRLLPIDWEYASKAVTELAKLHALSLAFQRDYPEKSRRIKEDHLIDWIKEIVFNEFWGTGVKYALSVLTDDNKRVFKKFSDDLTFASFRKLYVPLRVQVFTHGDYRPNNLMHRTLADGSLQVIVIDHQTIQVGCPVLDLLYLIFTGTDKAFRDEYYEKLIEFYYSKFSEAMRRLHIDPEKIYSKEDFYLELKKKLPYGLIAATYTLPLITIENDKVPESSDSRDIASFAIPETGPRFPARINGIVSDFVKWGVLTD